MVFNEKTDLFYICLGVSKAFENFFGDVCTLAGMFAGRVPFTDVMEKGCHQQIPSIPDLFINSVVKNTPGVIFFYFLKAVDLLDTSYGVFIHRKEVILIVLNLVDNSEKFRDKFNQKSGGQHDVEDIEFPEGRGQGFFKIFDMGRISAKSIIHQMDKFPHNPSGFNGKGSPGSAAFHENFQ